MTTSHRFWLALPFATVLLVDGFMTLCGQPTTYWMGDAGAVEELNPVGYVLLRYHPLVFALAVVHWMIGGVTAILLLPQRIAIPLALFLAFVHALGGTTWFWRIGSVGPVLALAYLFAAERFASFCWRKAGILSSS